MRSRAIRSLAVVTAIVLFALALARLAAGPSARSRVVGDEPARPPAGRVPSERALAEETRGADFAPGPVDEAPAAPALAPDAGREPEADHARLRFADRYCVALARDVCEAAAAAGCGAADCAAVVERRCRADVLAGAGLADDDQLIDEARLDACLDESLALTRAGVWPLGHAPSCWRLFVAPVAVGARCGDADLLCASGDGHCDGARICRRSQVGVPCDLDCGAGLFCVGGACRAEGAAPGEPCRLTSECAPAALCLEGRCAPRELARRDVCRWRTS